MNGASARRARRRAISVLPDAGRADHQDVLRRDLLAQRLGHLLAPPAVAQRDRDRTLGGVLPDDVLVELAHDFGGGHVRHRRPASEIARRHPPPRSGALGILPRRTRRAAARELASMTRIAYDRSRSRCTADADHRLSTPFGAPFAPALAAAFAAAFAFALAACASGDDPGRPSRRARSARGSSPSPAASGTGSSRFNPTTAGSCWWPTSAAFPRARTGS